MHRARPILADVGVAMPVRMQHFDLEHKEVDRRGDHPNTASAALVN